MKVYLLIAWTIDSVNSAVFGSNKKAPKGEVEKGTYNTQNSSGIHRVLVLMRACTRIRALCRKGKPVVRR